MTRKFFLAHSSADREFVLWLASRLIGRSIPVWYSDWEIKVGDSITGKIDAALAQMEGLLVVLSASSVTSHWMREELNAGLARHLDDRRIGIFPVRIDECTIPPLLAHRRYADFTGDRDQALRELVEALVPTATLVAEIHNLKGECKSVLGQISGALSDPQRFRLLLGQINAALERAVETRYAIEIRRDPGKGRFEPKGFFEQFDYLVDRGYDLRNPDWGMVVLLRNIYAHETNNLLLLLAAERELGERRGLDKDWLFFAIEKIEAIFDSLLGGAQPVSQRRRE